MVPEHNHIIRKSETALKEEKLKRLQKQQKELLGKLKAKKQKLASLEGSIESYRITVFSALSEAKSKIARLQEELRTQFQTLRKAKLLNSNEKKKLRELEMEIMPATDAPDTAKQNKRQNKASDSGEQGYTSAGMQHESAPPPKDDRQLRKVYIRLASVIHPDKATSPEQASVMHELMQRVNVAYKNGDIAVLLEIEQKYGSLLQQSTEVNLASIDYLQKLIDQLEQEVLLLQTQFDKVKQELSNIEKSDLGRMYKEYVKLKKYYQDPIKLITAELHETIEYLVKLKNSIDQFLDTGIMPPELETELHEEEQGWGLDVYFDQVFAADPKSRTKKSKTAKSGR